MSRKLNKPHDAFMKSLLGEIDLARDFLLQFLPAELREQLDLSTLAHDKSTFVNPALKEAFTDSVFSVKLRKGGDKECLISILIEHKSYADDLAAFQILHYLAQGYHQQLKNGQKRGFRKKTLRPIIPLMFYHGKKGWKLRPLKAQFDKAYGAVLQYVPSIEVVFADVAEMSEEEISRVADAWLQAALLTWKYSHDPVELLRRLAAIMRLISRGRTGNFFHELAVYLISLINIPEEEIMEALDSLPPDIKHNMMSTYDMILQKGRKEGKLEGKLEGKMEGLEEVVLRGHKNDLPIDTLSAITGLSEKDVEAIIAKHSRKKKINRS